MPDIPLTADDVGRIVIFIAPGFLARFAYRARFPARERPTAEVVVLSVVTSLPFVALATEVVGSSKPTDPGYVAVLLGSALFVGYALAILRGLKWMRDRLGGLKLSSQPEGSVYAQTLLYLPEDAPITVEFKDTRKLSGTPRLGPMLKEEGIEELYLTHPAWLQDDGTWLEGTQAIGAGIIVRLEEVHNIALSEDPT